MGYIKSASLDNRNEYIRKRTINRLIFWRCDQGLLRIFTRYAQAYKNYK